MLFSTSDIELLRLTAWCKNLPVDMHRRFGAKMFRPQESGLLEHLGLIASTGNGACIRMRPKGWRLLHHMGFNYHQDAGYRTDYERRLEVARILLTFYRAGWHVYADDWRELEAPQVFLQAPAVRRNTSVAGDLLGGTAFHGLTCIQDHLCACYYLTDTEYRLHHRNERQMLDKAAARTRRQPALVFAGSSYYQISRMLRKTMGSLEDDLGKSTYSSIYQDTPYPVYLLECSDAGALQLLIMSREEYRKQLYRVITSDPEPTPPPDVPDADGEGVPQGENASRPWVLGVDMDIKRLDRALRQTITAGCSQLVILCLESQKTALEYLYGKEKRVIIRAIPGTLLDKAFRELPLFEPAALPYINGKGDVLNAADLPVDRKTGKQVCPQAGEAETKD